MGIFKNLNFCWGTTMEVWMIILTIFGVGIVGWGVTMLADPWRDRP